jgi:hypothetical protein
VVPFSMKASVRIATLYRTYISLGFLVFLLLGQDLFQPFLGDSLDFLPHSQKLNHLLCIDSSRDELSYRHLVLPFHHVSVNVVYKVHLTSLSDRFPICHLLLLVRFCKLRVDNSQSQVQQEESSNEHEGHKEKGHTERIRILHQTLDVTPALHGYTLENS